MSPKCYAPAGCVITTSRPVHGSVRSHVPWIKIGWYIKNSEHVTDIKD